MEFRFRDDFNPLTYDQSKSVVTDHYFTYLPEFDCAIFMDTLTGEHYIHILQF
jgi:hypothetical protein